MAYRFTDTGKWGDSWFYKLNNLQKLLFMYLCDNCDHAGLIEVNERKWAFDMNVSEKELKGALEGLQRGLVFSNERDVIYLKNFIKHQKNLPFNQKNKAHLGIMNRLEESRHKFGFQNIIEFIEAPAKPLERGTGIGIGNGIGTGIGNCDEKKIKPEPKPKKIEVSEFVSMTEQEHQKLISDFGADGTTELIEILNNYKGSTGKRYKNDYLAIRGWVKDRYLERKAKPNSNRGAKDDSGETAPQPPRLKPITKW